MNFYPIDKSKSKGVYLKSG